ncbi:MAG: hypothetical protein ACRD0J_08645 [Acidimicrobiales bacterium]
MPKPADVTVPAPTGQSEVAERTAESVEEKPEVATGPVEPEPNPGWGRAAGEEEEEEEELGW